MDDDGGWTGGADILRLPMAVAEDPACDLVGCCGRDLDQLVFGWRKNIDARKVVAGDGLQVAVAQEAAGDEVRGVFDEG